MSKLQNEILDHIPTYKKNKRGKRISKKKLKIKKNKKLQNESCATILVDPVTFFELKPTPKKIE